ncbi:MAG: hypothetical protein CVV05_20195 [Gammaproteobacteria bacterium HGW-Gammaproteobacteria-1]|jgi:hypothetical protein|nr:MAG: hypothetical protein CVV12_03340 [Gammaproteobacteria bacterium HGW-Gammaproteobacteria-2]PKM41775.1 MAG: hypothetical protein CVV05_20195 [Gammaproteobacteria bacterium HGW-Gammaproteobacteria-1]
MDRRERIASSDTARQRQRITADAVRLMRDSGIADVASARQRAAKRLGIRDPRAMPELDEIVAALRTEQRLYAGMQHACHQRHLREAALEAMAFFSHFAPRLVGSVLDGCAEPHSAVCLHLYTDDCEAVSLFLDEQGITHTRSTRTMRLDREYTTQADALEFIAGDVPFALIVLPRSALRQAPLAPGSDAPMARASLVQLRALLQQGGPETGQP